MCKTMCNRKRIKELLDKMKYVDSFTSLKIAMEISKLVNMERINGR
jgi:hypothetical protein